MRLRRQGSLGAIGPGHCTAVQIRELRGLHAPATRTSRPLYSKPRLALGPRLSGISQGLGKPLGHMYGGMARAASPGSPPGFPFDSPGSLCKSVLTWVPRCHHHQIILFLAPQKHAAVCSDLPILQMCKQVAACAIHMYHHCIYLTEHTWCNVNPLGCSLFRWPAGRPKASVKVGSPY